MKCKNCEKPTIEHPHMDCKQFIIIMELKTLKDLIIYHQVKPNNKTSIIVGNTICNAWNHKIVQPDELKLEAIKWLKAKYHPDKTTMELSDFMDFHNISEEDLK